MDYTLPRAEDLPFFDGILNEVLSPTNSLGAKGAGEGGTTTFLDALTSAEFWPGVDVVTYPVSGGSAP